MSVDDLLDELEIEPDPFAMLPSPMFLRAVGDEPENPHLVSHGAAICYATLCHLGADKNFRMAQARIAARMGKSVRAVSGYLKELRDAGWLLVRPVYRARGRAASHYLVLRTPITGEGDTRWIKHQAALART